MGAEKAAWGQSGVVKNQKKGVKLRKKVEKKTAVITCLFLGFFSPGSSQISSVGL